MITLLGYFVAGFLSEYFVIKYYYALTHENIFQTILFNTILMNLNAYFINIVNHQNYFLTNVYVAGQALGIAIAIACNKRKKYDDKI